MAEVVSHVTVVHGMCVSGRSRQMALTTGTTGSGMVINQNNRVNLPGSSFCLLAPVHLHHIFGL